MIVVQRTAKKHEVRLRVGTIIRGKWHGNTYKVIRLLGSGTVGSVYLCTHQGRHIALKLSEQSISMTAEVQALKLLQKTKVQDSGLGPYLLDVDDWEVRAGKLLAFYAMEYVDGVSLQTFISRQGTVWIGPLLLQLLEQLERLHQIGYIFGDLKNDNIIITDNPPTVRLIDVGGMTKMGRSVKEYTNFYDRAYWRLGKRLAEPSYDLFAVTMVLLTIFYPRKFTRSGDSLSLIRGKISRVKSLHPYAPVLLRGVTSTYQTSQKMRHDLYKRIAITKRDNQKRSPKTFVTELLLISGSAFFFYGMYSLLANL